MTAAHEGLCWTIPSAVRRACERADETRFHSPKSYPGVAAEAAQAVAQAVENELLQSRGADRATLADIAWRLRWLASEADALGSVLTRDRAAGWAAAFENRAAA